MQVSEGETVLLSQIVVYNCLLTLFMSSRYRRNTDPKFPLGSVEQPRQVCSACTHSACFNTHHFLCECTLG